MATNKWQSQCIQRKFKNKHANISYTHTRKRNKRTNRRKARRFCQFCCKQNLFESDILNIKTMKGCKKQYIYQKQIEIDVKSVECEAPPLKLNFSLAMQFYHSPSKHWLPFKHFSYDSYQCDSYRINNIDRSNYRCSYYYGYNYYIDNCIKYQIKFKEQDSWNWMSGPQQRWWISHNDDNCFMDILMVTDDDKEIATEQIKNDKHFDKYYIKHYQGFMYIFMCFLSKYHRSPKRRYLKRNNFFIQRMISLQDGYCIIDFNEKTFKNVSIQTLKNYIDIEIICKHHYGIITAIDQYDREYQQKQDSTKQQATFNNTVSINRYHHQSNERDDNPEPIMKTVATKKKNKNDVEMVITMILDMVDGMNSNEHLFDDIYVKNRVFKLKNVIIKANWSGSSIVDLYEIKPLDSTNIEIPIKTVTDLEYFNYYGGPYIYGSKKSRYFKEQPILEVANECISKVMEKRDDKLSDCDENTIIINKCHETKCNVIPITFDFEAFLFEYIPSRDIIENILIPFLGYNKFYHCRDNLQINECHEPHFNLLPLSCKYSRLLYHYIPANDILLNVLIPFIGYDSFYYVIIDNGIGHIQNYQQHDNYIIHGENDNSTSVEHAKSLFNMPGAAGAEDNPFQIDHIIYGWWNPKIESIPSYDYGGEISSSLPVGNLFGDDSSTSSSEQSSW